MKSINGKLLLEPYVSDGSIKADVRKGVAFVKQKSSLVGLKAVFSSTWTDRNGQVQSIEPGTVVFFKEEDLHSQGWSKTLFNIDGMEKKFIIADANSAVMVLESK